MESHVHAGWLIETGAMVDKRQAYEGGQGGVKWLNPGGLEKMKEIVAKDIPPGHFQMNNTLERNMTDIAVINEEFMGTTEKDIPGVLGKLRQGSAITGIQGYFDGKRMAFRLLGRKMMKAAQIRYSEQQVSKYLNEPVSPEFFKKDLVGYDVVTEEGLLSDTQREIAYAELRELYVVTGGAQGSNIPQSALIQLAPISMSKVTKDAIARNEQAQQKQGELDRQAQQILQEMQMAQIATDRAQAAERMAAANENQAEAGFDRARTLAEIQKMGFDNVLKSAKTMEVLRTLQQPVAQGAA